MWPNPLQATTPYQQLPTQYCIICLTTEERENSLVPDHAEHRVCFDCALMYVRSQLENFRADITCPLCPLKVPLSSLRHLGGPALELVLAKADTENELNLCRSSMCQGQRRRLTLCSNFGYLGRVALIECNTCCATYCYFCRACVAANSRHRCATAESRRVARFAMRATHKTKPCPQCLKLVHRFEGCRNMHCRCGCDYCWDCLRVLPAAHDVAGCVGPPPATLAAKLWADVVEGVDRAGQAALALPRYWYERRLESEARETRLRIETTARVARVGWDLHLDAPEALLHIAEACQGRWVDADHFVAYDLFLFEGAPAGQTALVRVHNHSRSQDCIEGALGLVVAVNQLQGLDAAEHLTTCQTKLAESFAALLEITLHRNEE